MGGVNNPGPPNLGNYVGLTVDFSDTGWKEATSHECFVVTGLVRVRLIAECTVNCVGGTNIDFTDEVGSVTIIAPTTFNSIVAGVIWHAASANVGTELWSTAADYIVNGLDLGCLLDGATTSGGIIFHCWWEPLAPGASVVAGAGGVL